MPVRAKSLVWVRGELIDVAGGWRPIYPNLGKPQFDYGDQYDYAVAAQSGECVALVDTDGTTGMILDAQGVIVRKITRDGYHAEAYRYPLAFFPLPEGKTGLVHCPEAWNYLDIEDAMTGEKLTAGDREFSVVFHSRLAVSADSSLLLSAGWVWQPWGVLRVFDLAAAMKDVSRLDGRNALFSLTGLIEAEVAGACFVGRDVVVSTSDEPNDAEEPDDLAPMMLVRRSIDEERYVWRHTLEHCAGDLAPFAGGVLALNGHPRLFDADTGDLVAEWPDLNTGQSHSSIVWDKTFAGPARIALDSSCDRFAFTDGERAVIIERTEQGRPAVRKASNVRHHF